MSRKLSLFGVLVAVLLILSLVACSQAPSTQAPGTTSQASTPTSSSQTASGSQKTWNLKFAAYLPSTSHSESQCYLPYVMQIEAATNGRVKITPYEGGSLAKGSQVVEAVQSGLADIGYTAMENYYAGRIPLSSLTELPMLAQGNSVVRSKAIIDIYNKFPQVQQEYSGLKFLSAFAIPADQFETTKVPIRTMNDLKGLKLRAGGTMATAYMKALGATPVSISAADMYEALDKGTIDGAEFNLTGVQSWSLQKVLKYYTLAGILSTYWPFFMNVNTWNSFPPDIQNEIWNKIGGMAGAEFLGNAAEKVLQQNISVEKAAGGDFITPSQEFMNQLQEAAKPVWKTEIDKAAAKGLPGQAVVDDYINYVNNAGK